MEEESLVDVALAWTLLGIVVGLYILIKLDAANVNIADVPLDEPRVFGDRAEDIAPE